MKTETLKKANELEFRLNQLIFQRKEIQQIFDRHNQTKDQGNDFERKINTLSVVYYGDILISYLSEIDKLKEQLAELQDEPEEVKNYCNDPVETKPHFLDIQNAIDMLFRTLRTLAYQNKHESNLRLLSKELERHGFTK